MTAALTRIVGTSLTILAVSLAMSPVLSAGPVAAHSSEAGSTPEAGEVLVAAPSLVEVRFDSPLLDVGAAMVVRGSDGTSVAVGPPRVGRRSVSVDVDPDAPPGAYSVAYRVVAADGHALESSFGYTVTGDAPVPTEGTAGASPTVAPGDASDGPSAAEPSSTSPLVLLAGGVLVLLLAGAGAIALRR